MIVEQLMEFVDTAVNFAFMVWAFQSFSDTKALKMISHQQRVFYISLGWSTMHSLTHYVFPVISLFFKREFSWKFIEAGVDSQVHLFKFCAWAILAYQLKQNGYNPTTT